MPVAVDRYRYGDVALWALRGDLEGREARRIAERADLHLRTGARALLLDVRALRWVDSAGAAALRASAARPGCRIVGRPAGWGSLPLAVREALRRLLPAPDLVTALSAATTEGAPARGAEQRVHLRIPLQIPVELAAGGRTVLVSLHDMSRAGAGLALVPPGWLPELQSGPADLGLLGLAADPLGREITGIRLPELIPVAVARCGGDGRVGVLFRESPPPV